MKVHDLPWSAILMHCRVLASSVGLGTLDGAFFNPLTMGFITRLSVEPEHESAEEKSARLLLRTEVTNACMDAVNRHVLVRVQASQCDCDEKCQCPRNFMEPGQLARFILELSSFADSQSLSRVMWKMLTIDPGSRPHWEIRSFWLSFWHRLVNMDASSLEACAPAFWQRLNYSWSKYQEQREVVHYPRHNPVGGSDPSSTTTDSLTRGVYDWLANPKSTPALVATRSLHRLQTHYDGLHGKYLSTRVTPIPGTDQGELLIVKRYQNTFTKEDVDDDDVKPFGDVRSMVRAELEWRLFTEFRPILPFMLEGQLIFVLGHSVKLDRDVGSLDDAYLAAFNVPSTQKFSLPPEIAIESTPAPAAPAARDRRVVKTEPERPGVRRRPRAQLLVNAEPAAPVPAASPVVNTEPDRPGVRHRPRAQLIVNAGPPTPLPAAGPPVVKTERQDVRLAHRVPRAQLLANAEPSANRPRPTGEVAAPVPAARPTVKAESPVSTPEPPIRADNMDAEDSAKEEPQDADVAMMQDVPAVESPAQADVGDMEAEGQPPPRRGVKRRASGAEQPLRRMGLRIHSRREGGE